MSGVLLSPVGLVPLLPALAALGLWFLPPNRGARMVGWLAVGCGGVALAAALALPWQLRADGLVRVDPLAAHMSVVTALSVLAGLWFGRSAADGRRGALALGAAALLQIAVLSNTVVLTLAALEGALLLVLLAPGQSMARGGEAAWRGLLLVVAGLGLGLLGAALMAGAALPVLGPGSALLRWDALAEAAPRIAARPLSVAVALLLAGAAVCAGLAPAHGWLDSTARRGQAALLAPAVGVALLVLLRVRQVAAGQPESLAPGPPLLVLGLLSVLAAALWLVAGRRARQVGGAVLLLHAGLAVFAFGLGGTRALAAGLTVLSAAVVLLPIAGAGRIAQAGVAAALALMPPFASFGAAIVLLGEAVREGPWLALPLAVGLAVAVAALARRLARQWRGPVGAINPSDTAAAGALLALVAGVGMLPAAGAWFDSLARGLR